MTFVSTHCSFQGRAWTDLISNATSIAPDEETDDPRPWLGEIPGGAAHVGAFIHEFTHHWCFNSVVGAALSTVAHRAALTATALLMQRAPKSEEDLDDLDRMRQLRLAVAMPPRTGLINSDPDRLRELLVGDVVRMETAISVLRPLAEGLAMFAEFDATSRLESEAWSPLPLILATYFADLDNLFRRFIAEPITTLYSAGDVLSAYRLDASTVQKKSDLLTAALTSAYDGGYLVGYLAVKSMWRHLCEKQERLRGETDLMLAFLRSYFYEDPVLAGLILDTDGPDASVTAIANRVNTRIHEFECIRSEDITDFERRLVDSANRPADTYRPTGILVDESGEVAERIITTLDQIQRDQLSWSLGDVRQLMIRRREVTLTSVPVTLEFCGPGRFGVKWAGHWIDEVRDEDWLEQPTAATSEARLEVIATLTGDRLFHRAAFVTVKDKAKFVTEDKLVACRAYGMPDELAAIRSEMLDSHRTRAAMASRTTSTRFIVDQLIADDIPSRFYIEWFRSPIPEIVDGIYRDTALWFATETAAADRCADLMAEDGMAGLNISADHLAGLALAGLAISLDPTESFLREQFERFSLDLDDTVEALKASRATHGFPPTLRADEHRQFFTVI